MNSPSQEIDVKDLLMEESDSANQLISIILAIQTQYINEAGTLSNEHNFNSLEFVINAIIGLKQKIDTAESLLQEG